MSPRAGPRIRPQGSGFRLQASGLCQARRPGPFGPGVKGPRLQADWACPCDRAGGSVPFVGCPRTCRYRLGVRTVGSQPSNRGSNPRTGTSLRQALAPLAGYGWQASVICERLRRLSTGAANAVSVWRRWTHRLIPAIPVVTHTAREQYVRPSPRRDRTRPRAFPSPNEQRSAAHEAGTTGATIRRFCQLTLLAVITSSNEKAFLAALGALHKLTTSSLE